MNAASEEPEFDSGNGGPASENSTHDSTALGDAGILPALPEQEAPRPHPWRFWLAWSAIVLGAVMFGHSWWRARQHAIAVEQMNEAVDRISAGQLAEAVSVLTEVVERDPNLAIAWANRAAAHIRLKKYDEARRDCEAALAIDSKNAVALANLGAIKLQAGDLIGAREALTRSIASDPAAGEAWVIRARVALSLGENEAAVDDANEALSRLRDSRHVVQAYEVRGTAFLATGNSTAALSDFSEASRLEPGNPDYQMRIAHCHDARGELNEAELHATNAVNLADDKGRYYEGRANVRFRLKKYAEVIDDCNRALESDPKSALALMMRGGTRNELGELVEATADFDAALEIDPALFSARLFRGDAWRRRGEPARAIDDYSEAIRLKPDLMLAWFGRGVARSQMRDYEEAIADYSRAIELVPGFAPAWYNRSIAHEAVGKIKEAKADRQKALELDPQIGSVGRTEST